MTKEMNYKQGNTVVWTDGEKLVVRNPAGPSHVKTNIDHIFGIGEYEKIVDAAYLYDVRQNKRNRLSKTLEIMSPYIPERALNDLGKEPGQLNDDQMKKYFGDLV